MAINLKGNDDSTFSNDIAPSTGKGIDFTANKSANTVTSNTLTVYEEGTFTPDVIWRDGNSGVTSPAVASNNEATYTRIGNRFFASFNTNNITVAPDLGSANPTCGIGIQNLPFNGVSQFAPCGNVYYGGVTDGRPDIFGFQFGGNSGVVGFGFISNTTGSPVNGTDIYTALTTNGNTSLVVTLSYEVSI